jgi:hypothetical protein
MFEFIDLPDFPILRPDAEAYEILLIQPRSNVFANGEFIGNADKMSAANKYRDFFRIASEIDPDLVLTPEYSCPWNTVGELLRTGPLPNVGKLWAIGCEAITPKAFREFVNQNNGFDWRYDANTLDKPGVFLDSVCYIWRLPHQQNGLQFAVTVQFKVTPMVETQEFLEQEKLIRGDKRYVFRNNANSIYLTTIICSDSLSFNMSQLPDGYLHQPYLILQPQLNTNPRHGQFKKFRSDAYKQASPNKEFLCYNWARGSEIPALRIKIEFAGSALYTKTKFVHFTDQTVNLNHGRGMYYTRCHADYYGAFFFNFDEHVFHCRVTKCSQAAVLAAQAQPIPPELQNVYEWDATNNCWASCTPSDGFSGLCASVGADVSPLTSPALNPVDKERLLFLSCGLVNEMKPPWYNFQQLGFFSIADDEIIKRMTFSHDPNASAVAERARFLGNFSILRNNILMNQALYPPCLKYLAGHGQIHYPIDDAGRIAYEFNFWAPSKPPATVAYVGVTTSPYARQCFDSMSTVLRENRGRLVVWYSDHTGFVALSESESAATVDKNLTEDPRSIAKEE